MAMIERTYTLGIFPDGLGNYTHDVDDASKYTYLLVRGVLPDLDDGPDALAALYETEVIVQLEEQMNVLLEDSGVTFEIDPRSILSGFDLDLDDDPSQIDGNTIEHMFDNVMNHRHGGIG